MQPEQKILQRDAMKLALFGYPGIKKRTEEINNTQDTDTEQYK